MAGLPPYEDPLQPLKYQTWILKVSIHCQGCQKKIKRVLQRIDGVYTINIDLRQQRVVVTGDIEPQTLIKKLMKIGRHAELWQETFPGKERKSMKKEKEGGEDGDDEEEENQNPPENVEGRASGNMVRFATGDHGGVKDQDNVIAGEMTQGMVDNKGNGNNVGPAAPAKSGGKKKKKKKGNKGKNAGGGAGAAGAPTSVVLDTQNTGPIQTGDNQGPPFQPLPSGQPPQYPYAPSYAPQQGYVVHYSTAYPCMRSDQPTGYAPPSPYAGEFGRPRAVYRVKPSPLMDTFQILSEENPNGCRIM